jgi:hypothetical protein
MTRKIVVESSTNVEEALRNYVPSSPEEHLQREVIASTVKMFQMHLAQLSGGNSTVDLKKVLRFGNETVVITCSKRAKSLLQRIFSRFGR